jgi:hypothetical protein
MEKDKLLDWFRGLSPKNPVSFVSHPPAIRLNPEPDEDHLHKTVLFPLKAFSILYKTSLQNGSFPLTIYLYKDIFLKILKTRGAGLEEYILEIDGVECKVNTSKLFGTIPPWLLNLLKQRRVVEYAFEPPKIEECFLYTQLFTLEKFSEEEVSIIYQEAFVNDRIFFQFEWMLGDILIPPINSCGLGYRFSITDPKVIQALKLLAEEV